MLIACELCSNAFVVVHNNFCHSIGDLKFALCFLLVDSFLLSGWLVVCCWLFIVGCLVVCCWLVGLETEVWRLSPGQMHCNFYRSIGDARFNQTEVQQYFEGGVDRDDTENGCH